MQKATFSLFLLSWLFGAFVFAQQKGANISEYAYSIIETLSSEEFAGRGYVDGGMDRAADFVAHEFEKIGLKRIGYSYFQEFEMPINIIRDAGLKLNGKELEYGVDFIVKPSVKSQKFHRKPIYEFNPKEFARSLDSETKLIQFIEKDYRAQEDKHVVFPPHQFAVDSLKRYYKDWANFYRADENRNRAILFFTPDKLVSSLAQKQDSIAQFFISEKYYRNDLSIDDYFIDTEFVSNFKVKNVIGKIEGRQKDSLIVITAHYDHLGKVGKAYFPGASDNASGTAFLLELARYFAQNPPEYTLVFIAFAAEEAGMVGAYHFVEQPLFELDKIKFLLNFDIMGGGDDGIQIVNSSIFTKEYELLNQINSENKFTKQIKKRGEACNSDHCPFYKKGVPSFFTYTLGGPGHYHDVYDKADTLNLVGFNGLQELFKLFIESL